MFPQWIKSAKSLSWTGSQNWSPAVVPNGVGAVANLWTLGGGTIDLGSTHVTLSTLSLNSTGTTSYDVIATAGGSLVLQGSGGLAANVDVLGGSQTIAAAVTLSTSTDVAINNSTDRLAITGAISGSGALNLSGSGTLVLSGSDTYSGGTNVEGGTLIFKGRRGAPRGDELDRRSRRGHDLRFVGSRMRRPLPTRAPRSAAGQCAVPEPGTAVLLAIAGMSLGLAGWRRSRQEEKSG